MTRPTLDEIKNYRDYVDKQMVSFITKGCSKEISHRIEIGLQHEQQHQELLLYDIKYIFGHQPVFPSLDFKIQLQPEIQTKIFIPIDEGVYNIGYKGDGFCWDNEQSYHKAYIHAFEISNKLVTNAEYIEFIDDGGYSNFKYWHAEGWDHIKIKAITAPMYWHKVNNRWMQYTLNGFTEVNANTPVSHISFYEAFAFSQWKNMRLPTEFEWEIASQHFSYGQLWEWTNSAYLPYPNYKKADGAFGEYNGKFMLNQMVLKGASVATSKNHSRPTYRNFFQPEMRWHFAGIRLVK